MSATNRILIIVTNSDQFEKVGYRTGLWLSELVEFWDVAEEAGYKMDIASPSGGKVPLDPESLPLIEMGDAVGLKGSLSQRYEDKAFMSLLDSTLKVSDVDPAMYDAIYMAGGPGVMFDFPKSTSLAELTAGFHEAGKIVSAVGHGSCGLLEVKLSDGTYLVEGKEVTLLTAGFILSAGIEVVSFVTLPIYLVVNPILNGLATYRILRTTSKLFASSDSEELFSSFGGSVLSVLGEVFGVSED